MISNWQIMTQSRISQLQLRFRFSMNKIKVCAVVAAGSNYLIGINNKLPWHLPKDLQHFKSTTLNKPIVMGRKTFESIGRPLPGRHNIVITRQQNWSAEGVVCVGSLAAALSEGEAWCLQHDQSEIMIIGGAEIYQQSQSLVERIYLTRVEATLEGDAFFPPLDEKCWHEISRENHFACDQNLYNYSFCVLERVTSGDK